MVKVMRDGQIPAIPNPGEGSFLMTLLRSIVILIIALLQAGPATAPSTMPSRTVWDGVYSGEQSARGKRAYATLCARCHGDTLLGNDDAVPLVGKDFVGRWEGKSVAKLVELTRTEMPSDGPGKLTRKQCTDITAYILSANGFPAGPGEVAAELNVLEAILIRTKK